MKEGDVLIVTKPIVVERADRVEGEGIVRYDLIVGHRLEVCTVFHTTSEVTGYRVLILPEREHGFSVKLDDPFLQHCKVELPQEPVGAWLMLKPKIAPEKTKSGIWIPEQARDNAHQGVILKKGGDVPREFDIGDEVVFTQHTEYKLTVDGVPIVLVNHSDVILRTPSEYVIDEGTDSTPPTT